MIMPIRLKENHPKFQALEQVAIARTKAELDASILRVPLLFAETVTDADGTTQLEFNEELYASYVAAGVKRWRKHLGLRSKYAPH